MGVVLRYSGENLPFIPANNEFAMPKRLCLCLLLLVFVEIAAEQRLDAQGDFHGYSDLILTDQPVAYWDFAESKSAKSVSSQAKIAFPGKLMGKVMLDQQGPRPTAFPLFGPANKAADFPGG